MKSRFQSLVVMALGAVAVVASPCFGITNNLDVLGEVSWSFEPPAFTNGQDIVNPAVDSWYGDPGSLVAFSTNYAQPTAGHPLSSTGHTMVAQLSANVTNLVTGGAGKSIWIDHLVLPRRWDQDGDPTDIPADAQMAYYINTNGNPVLYHRPMPAGTPAASNAWTVIPEITIASDTWARVSVNMDYDSNFGTHAAGYFFRIKVDGVLATNATAVKDLYPVDAAAGSYFLMGTTDGVTEMSAISLHGTGLFDDFVVTTNAPDITVSFIIASSVADGANGGNINPVGDILVEEGSNQTFVVTNNMYWIISKVVTVENGVTSTNLTPASPFTNTFASVSAGGSIQAFFEAQTTSSVSNIDVPVWWMQDQGVGGQDPDSTASDGDSLTLAQEWIASQDPNATAEFEITATWQAGGTNYVEWVLAGVDPSLPPMGILRSTNLTDGFLYHGSQPRVEGTNTWSEPTPAMDTYYRISATNAP